MSRFICTACAAILMSVMASTASPTALAAQGSASAAPQPLYLLVYERGPAWVEGKPMHEQKLGDHVAYILDLIGKGRIVAGGPFGDENGGMAIVRAESLAEAEAILAEDPALKNGTFTGSVRQWIPVLDSGQPLRR